MATPVKMPQMGESVVEGTIIKWLRSEGDSVDMDDALVEVSTDKVDTEIPSPVAGTITKLLVQEGETVEVGTPLCEIDEGGEAGGAQTTSETETAPPKEETVAEAARTEPEAKPAAQSESQPEAQPEAKPAREPAPAPPRAEPAEPKRAAARAPERGGPPTRTQEAGRPGQVLSPLVRRLARERGVDLTQVRGTGAGGRITKDDVLTFGDGRAAAAAPEAPPAAERQAPPAARAASAEREEVQPLTHIRKRIAEHMVKSLHVSARAWNAVDIDMENIAQLRAEVNPEFKRTQGYSLTYLPFIARACVDALAAVPVVNASISEDLTEAIYHHYVNLGIAVATDYGLIVPVVKGAEGMTVTGIARAIREQAEKARTKTLSPDDVTGSTFTITNPGPFGSILSVPVINQPNVAIIGTEAVEQRVVAVDGMIGVRHRMYISMSWDHRLLDGADAMRFLARLKENLETWDFSREVTQP